jgi:hypothetical protein
MKAKARATSGPNRKNPKKRRKDKVLLATPGIAFSIFG